MSTFMNTWLLITWNVASLMYYKDELYTSFENLGQKKNDVLLIFVLIIVKS